MFSSFLNKIPLPLRSFFATGRNLTRSTSATEKVNKTSSLNSSAPKTDSPQSSGNAAKSEEEKITDVTPDDEHVKKPNDTTEKSPAPSVTGTANESKDSEKNHITEKFIPSQTPLDVEKDAIHEAEEMIDNVINNVKDKIFEQATKQKNKIVENVKNWSQEIVPLQKPPDIQKNDGGKSESGNKQIRIEEAFKDRIEDSPAHSDAFEAEKKIDNVIGNAKDKIFDQATKQKNKIVENVIDMHKNRSIYEEVNNKEKVKDEDKVPGAEPPSKDK